MTFQPKPNDQLTIGGANYVVAEHPVAPGMPYGQEGRAATVYKLVSGGGERALKVFKPRFQVPSLVSLGRKLQGFSSIGGLRVCSRSVLTSRGEQELLSNHPDLLYAVLMPWIEGPTWMEALLDKCALTPDQSLSLARALTDVLATMEEEGLAHCDLSGSNVLIPALVAGDKPADHARHRPASPIELVDVEGMFGPELRRPETLPSGSMGYAHATAAEGLWSPDSDRFAGGVLIVEMLGWCDPPVRDAAWGENYFDPSEMQRDGDRYRLLADVLRERWGEGVAGLFGRVWESGTLGECPTFGAWVVQLGRVGAGAQQPQPIQQPQASRPTLTQASHAAPFQEASIEPPPTQPYYETPPLAQSSVYSVPSSGYSYNAPTVAVSTPAVKAQQEVADLFDEGLAAWKRDEWEQARELLREVVRRKPEYARGGLRATLLLRDAESHVAASPSKRQGWGWTIIPAILLGLLAGFGGIVAYQAAGTNKAQTTATTSALETTVTVSELTVVANATALAISISTAQTVSTTNVLITALAAQESTKQASQTSLALETTTARTAIAQETALVQANLTAETQQLATQIGNMKALQRINLQGDVTGLAFSPNSKLLATGSDEGVRLWSLSGGNLTELHTLQTNVGELSNLAFSPDGALLAASPYGGPVTVWSLRDGRQLWSLPGELLVSVKFSHNGKVLASLSNSGDGGEVTLWSMFNGQKIRTLQMKGTASQVRNLPQLALWQPNVVYAVSFQSLPNGAKRIHGAPLHGYLHLVSRLDFSPDGRMLAAGTYDGGKAYIWSVEDGTALGIVGGSQGLTFSPDSKQLVVADITVGGGGMIAFWDWNTGSITQSFRTAGAAKSLSFSPTKPLLAVGTFRNGVGNVELLDTTIGQRIGALGSLAGEDHGQEVFNVTFSPDGKLLAAATFNEVWLWDADAIPVR